VCHLTGSGLSAYRGKTGSDWRTLKMTRLAIPEVAPTDELSLCAPDQRWLALLSASLLIAEVV
jgi:hypothetical protein